MTPNYLAEKALAVAKKGRSCSVFIPSRWGWVARIVRWLPSFIFRRLNF
jgi:hypothetical protein